jgi:hypothetical protein
VEAAIRIAWAARPRTTEHTTIMSWPTLALPQDNEMRLAVHMMGLNAQAPSTYPITVLVRHRLGVSFTTYERRKNRACQLIAECLNRGMCSDATLVAA